MWERVMRLSGAEVVGRRVRDVFPNASPSTYAARQQAYREGRPSTGNAWHYRWTTSDGASREADFRYIYQPLRTAAGEIAGLLLSGVEGKDEKGAGTPGRSLFRSPPARHSGMPDAARP